MPLKITISPSTPSLVLVIPRPVLKAAGGILWYLNENLLSLIS